MGEQKIDLEQKFDRGLARVQVEVSASLICHLVVSTQSNDCCLCVCVEQAENTVVSLKL